jgi:hypothetical protein
MGVLLVLGKLVIVGERWLEEGFQVPLVGVVCAVVGISSLLVAVFVGMGESPEDWPLSFRECAQPEI